jgi:hypothetical protein
MIGLLVGPDIFAVTELTTLLELIGATMFLLTFAVGFWALGLSTFERLRGFLLPVEHVALIRMRGKPCARIHGACLISRTGLFLCCYGFLAYAWISELVRWVP